MSLPHRVCGLIVELGTVKSESVTLPNGDVVPSSLEDHQERRKHVHLGGVDGRFKYIPSGNHHYYANFKSAVLMEVPATLDNGNPNGMDLDTDTKTVLTEAIQDGGLGDNTDDLPSWLTVTLLPHECRSFGDYFTYDFSTIDEGHPEFTSSSQENAPSEAQALFDAYCNVLRQSLTPFDVTYAYGEYVSDSWGLPLDDSIDPYLPRYATENAYEHIEPEPYETPVAPYINSNFISPWYKSVFSEGGLEPVRIQRPWYDFSFKITKPDWGPWRVTDQNGIFHEAYTEEVTYTYVEWVFDQYVQGVYPDQGMYDRFPNKPPYWTDEDLDGQDDTWWVPYGHSEERTETQYIYHPEWWEYKTYEFNYPLDCRPSHTAISKWKVAFEYRPDPRCCGPEGKTIEICVRVNKAYMHSSIDNQPVGDWQDRPYKNAHLRGYAQGRMGDRGKTSGRGLTAINQINMPYAYFGVAVRPVYSNDYTESVLTFTRTIGSGMQEEIIELPVEEGRVTFIRDFWIQSIN